MIDYSFYDTDSRHYFFVMDDRLTYLGTFTLALKLRNTAPNMVFSR